VAVVAPPVAPPPVATPPVAAPPRAAPAAAVDVRQLAERWDDVVDQARAARPLVGTALAATLPVAVAASGTVTIELQEPNDAHALALENGQADILAAIRAVHPGAARVVVRTPAGPAAAAPERLTTETVKAERIATLSKRDPVLGAAIEALDLDLLD
jgi:hypothetical protein